MASTTSFGHFLAAASRPLDHLGSPAGAFRWVRPVEES